MNDVHLYLLGGEIDERVGEGLYGAVHITLDDDVEFLHAAHGDTCANLLQSDAVLGADTLLTLQLQSLVGYLAHLLLAVHHVEGVACLRRTVQTQQRGSPRRAYALDLAAALVGEVLHTTVACAGNHVVADVQRAVAHQDGGHIAASPVERRLDNGAGGLAVGVGLQLQHVGLQQHLLQQVVDANALLGGDILALVLTSPVLHQQVHVGQRALHLLGVGTGLVYLVDGKHHGHSGGLCMADGLLGLGHHIVVGGNDDDGYIRGLCTAGTHGGKRLVARRVEEGDVASVLQRHVVGADMLGDATGLAGNHVTLAYPVKQRCLAVVHVAHHGNDGVSGLEVLGLVLLLMHGLRHGGADILGLEAELLSHHVDSLGVHALVDAYHHADAHAGADHLGHRHIHHACQLVGGHKLRQLEHLALAGLLAGLQLHLLAYLVALLAAILGAAGKGLLALQAGKSLLYLLCHILVRDIILVQQ